MPFPALMGTHQYERMQWYPYLSEFKSYLSEGNIRLHPQPRGFQVVYGNRTKSLSQATPPRHLRHLESCDFEGYITGGVGRY